MADAGYSGTPLTKKLGLKPGQRVCFINLPESLSHLADFEGLASTSSTLPAAGDDLPDIIHMFEVDSGVLAELADGLRHSIQEDGMIWISWPKKATKVPTSITEDVLREIFLPTGLVDVKVCAVDEIWSGLKFMIRKELR